MDTYTVQYIQLQVRISNRAALSLYRDTLGYTVHKISRRYCKPSCSYLVTSRIYALALWGVKLGLTYRSGRYTDADGEDAFSMRLCVLNPPHQR